MRDKTLLTAEQMKLQYEDFQKRSKEQIRKVQTAHHTLVITSALSNPTTFLFCFQLEQSERLLNSRLEELESERKHLLTDADSTHSTVFKLQHTLQCIFFLSTFFSVPAKCCIFFSVVFFGFRELQSELQIERESREESDQHNTHLRTSVAELTTEKGKNSRK